MRCCVSLRLRALTSHEGQNGRGGLNENFLTRGSCRWAQGSRGRPGMARCYCCALRLQMGLWELLSWLGACPANLMGKSRAE